ncbi:MAG: tetratricopeptide repeat protein [Gammaproteobacteria bacterium]
MSIFQELKRRHVTRVAAAYIVGAWLAIQIAVSILPAFDLDHLQKWIIIAVAAGFIPTLIFSWVFEWTPGGFKRDDEVDTAESVAPSVARRLDQFIVVTLVVAVGYFAVDKFVLSESREATIAEAAREEGRIAGKLESFGETSIAVMPFTNRSANDSDEYFSDGVSAEVLGLLAQIKELRVVSRASSFAFKGKNTALTDMAKKLNVAYVLDGSVRMKDSIVRISVQLIDAETDAYVWSETYNRELKDVFAVQDDIARQVTTAMKITLVKKLPQSAVTSEEAYLTYLKGEHASHKGTKEGYIEALDFFAKTIDLDPGYSLVRINRASIYAIQAARGFIPYEEGFAQAIEAADEAYEIDPDLSSSVRGWIAMMYERDYPAAARLLKRAIAVKPNDASIMNNSAVLANVLGRTPLAIELMKNVAEIAPQSPIPRINLASWYADIGDYDNAELYSNKALEINPDIFGAPLVLARLPLYDNKPAVALELAEKIKQDSFKHVVKAIAMDEMGDRVAADVVLQSMITEHDKDWGYFIAMVYARRGDADLAFEWIDKAITENQNINALKTDVFFEKLYADSRWEQSLERIGLAEAQVGSIVF